MQPLTGVRVLITRARGQASALAEQLATQGATPILIPTIELAPPFSWCPLDATLASIRAFDWLLFTSANAVQAYMQRAQTLNLPPYARHIAVIGPATARAVIATGLAPQVDLIPSQYIAESFAEALSPHAPGASMLLVRAAEARDLLPSALTEAGAQVTVATAYRSIVPPDSIAALQDLFAAPDRYPHAITFTSASTAENLFTLLSTANLKLPPGIAQASIGPITSQAMRDLGMEPTIEARESTIPALVEALIFWIHHDPSP